MTAARAFWAVGPRRGEIRAETLAPPADGQLRLRTLHTGVSCGTERLVLDGRVPEAEWERMRAPMQAGAFPFPVKYGYCAVGVVEAGPAELIGATMFCLGPHQDVVVAPVALCRPLPPGLPPRRAVLAANMETALNILWDAVPIPGERALVIGAGVVGLLVARLLAAIPGVTVEVHDLDPRRAPLIEASGARPLLGSGYELIVHASGSAAGLRAALAHAAPEGRIIEASWHGDAEVALPLGAAFHAARLTLRSSQVGQVGAAMRGRRTHAQRLDLALALLADPFADALLGPDMAFEDLPTALPALLFGTAAPLCPVVNYPPPPN